jgi:hypothetical protein
MNLYKKNLLFRSHPRSPVYATAVSLVLIGRMRTTCRPKPCPSPLPTPYLFQVPDQGHQENRGRRGRSRCWSSPVSCAPTEFSHGSDPSYMPVAPVISDRSPFYGENTPVGAPEPKMSPPSQQRSFGGGRGGGYQGEERSLMGGGGQGGKTHVLCLKYLLSEKNSQGRYTWILPTFLVWITAIVNTLVIRSSLKDWQSMKKECIHARHNHDSLTLSPFSLFTTSPPFQRLQYDQLLSPIARSGGPVSGALSRRRGSSVSSTKALGKRDIGYINHRRLAPADQPVQFGGGKSLFLGMEAVPKSRHESLRDMHSSPV